MTAALIGLGGYLRSGKDEVAGVLEEQFGFARLGMSDALHEAMLAIDPIVVVDEFVQYPEGAPGYGWNTPRAKMSYSELVEAVGYVEAKKRPEVRRLLQALGTEVGRDMIGTNTWSDIMARKVEALLKQGRSVVATGIRFPNEVQMLRSFAGAAVWVDRPGFEPSASSHASETSVGSDDFDMVIRNTGTLEQLHEGAAALGRRYSV
ncbi:hypothetical protein ACI7YT_12725 [Microbacterium sp. M]|uniref:deoxynucleotide monophosphate kinase family protein n=1 Tax=Microbacterium sp. M TaxID=3377125 RepID=UPI00386C22FB